MDIRTSRRDRNDTDFIYWNSEAKVKFMDRFMVLVKVMVLDRFNDMVRVMVMVNVMVKVMVKDTV